jgi:hypothetical protein
VCFQIDRILQARLIQQPRENSTEGEVGAFLFPRPVFDWFVDLVVSRFALFSARTNRKTPPEDTAAGRDGSQLNPGERRTWTPIANGL